MKPMQIVGLGVVTLALLAGVGVAGAASFTDIVDFDPNLVLGGTGSTTWTHKVPGDFSVPPDLVLAATLDLYAKQLTPGGETVLLGSWLSTDSQSWTAQSVGGGFKDYTIDIGAAFGTWSGSSLPVTLFYQEKGNNGGNGNKLILDKSVFSLQYENGTTPAAVPVPSSVLLLGSGLAGLAVAKRARDVSRRGVRRVKED